MTIKLLFLPLLPSSSPSHSCHCPQSILAEMKQSDPFSVKRSWSGSPPFEVILYHVQHWVQILKSDGEGLHCMPAAYFSVLRPPVLSAQRFPLRPLHCPACPSPLPLPPDKRHPVCAEQHAHLSWFRCEPRSEASDHAFCLLLFPASGMRRCWKHSTPRNSLLEC